MFNNNPSRPRPIILNFPPPVPRDQYDRCHQSAYSLTDAAAPRHPRKPHPAGSILIFVVVLLVLLALIGTAYISTTRSDRYAARQNALSAQEDLLLEGVKNMATGDIVGGLFDNSNNFRPAGTNSTIYHDYTSPTGYAGDATFPAGYEDTWLAGRVPMLMSDIASAPVAGHVYSAGDIVTTGATTYYVSLTDANATTPPGANWMLLGAGYLDIPIWPKMSAPLGPTGTVFEDPATGTTWDYFHNAFITSNTFNGVTYPAIAGSTGNYIAGDADGDGIADCGLVKLPMANLDGLTWYYGVRIIDNNSAVNAATAWKPNSDFTNTAAAPPQVPGDFFPTNIDLGGLLYTGDAGTEMSNWNTWRFNAAAWSTTPVTDAPAARVDFSFISPYDQLWSQLGRRVDNPGYDTTTDKFQAASRSDQINLAQGFVVKGSSESNMEATLVDSLYTSPGGTNAAVYRTAPYAANDYATWFNDNFNYGSNAAFAPLYAYHTARPLLVSRNPVMNTMRSYTLPAVTPAMNPNNYKAKVDVNKATFQDLWGAFWNVMHDSTTGATPNQRMFTTSAIRSNAPTPPTALTADQMAILRSAIAAVNTEDIRDTDDNVTGQAITIPAVGAGAVPYDAVVYGTERQPFIVAALVDIDTTTAKRYVAIELYNPYPVAIPMTNWVIARMNDAVTPKTLTVVHTFTSADSIPAGGWMVIENAADRPATIPPPAVASGSVVDATDANWAATAPGREMVLLRPRAADGTLAAIPDETQPQNLVPLDQIDLLSAADPAAPATEARYTYQRNTMAATPWKWVYSGWSAGTGMLLTLDPTNTVSIAWGTNLTANYPLNFTIQLDNTGWPGPNPMTSTPPNAFPFGGFARNGDILQIPFIGGYRISPAAPAGSTDIIELNSVTMDSNLAEDGTNTDDAIEQIGRFCPLRSDTYAGVDSYAWAAKLLDYLTVQDPANDYLPDVDPTRYPLTAPQAVANGSNPSSINEPAEDNAPINGLININTASWKVLNTLPLVTTAAGAIDPVNNLALAKAIFQDRIKNGPFQSIFDLNRVTAFDTLNGTFNIASDPQAADGDITPLTSADGVAGDFEARYLALNRISNLITTRSDSFTVYIVLEGWENAGTASAKLITTRRAAYIIDRSGVTATNTTPQVMYVPNQ